MAYHWCRLVVEYGLDTLEHLWSEFGDNLKGLEIVNDLLWFACAQDDGRGTRFRSQPCKSEMGDLAIELYKYDHLEFEINLSATI